MKTTKRHYDYFRKRCNHYQKELGLMGWDLNYLHEDLDPYARLQTKSQSCVATIVLSTGDWKDKGYIPINNLELDILAWHEMVHLRLADLAYLASTRFTSEDEIDKAVESAVAALENFYRNNF